MRGAERKNVCHHARRGRRRHDPAALQPPSRRTAHTGVRGAAHRGPRMTLDIARRRPAPLPSRRVAASRGQYRWCGGGGSLHRPAAGAAITSMRGGCRRLVWLEAYAAPPKPYCRSSAWRLGRAAVVVADGIWRRRRRLALPSGRNSDPAALAGGGAPTAARPWLRIHLTPFLLNGYPCLLCPCVVCFKFLQPKVIEGKKIDCALADPHLPRLLGGAPQLFTRTKAASFSRLLS